MRRLAILGVTGSIGRQALEVVARERDRIGVVAITAGSDLDGLADAARRLRPALVGLESAADPDAARQALAAACPEARAIVGAGAAARVAAEAEADTVLNAIVGRAGLEASLATLERGARLALANKETLVIGGPLIVDLLRRRGGELIPVDSEHSAALQCLGGRPAAEVERLILTASGGALRDRADWREATPVEVLAHPVWRMGRRITVDSALLVNKAFELIEARWLFGIGLDRIEAVLHPEARVHAIARFTDGSVVLQAAPPDMRLPIQLALSWPERWGAAVAPLPIESLGELRFAPLPAGRFPGFDVALAAGRAGGTAPCALNAADEVAVAAFLEGRIALGQVPEILERVLAAHDVRPVESVVQLAEVDLRARQAAAEAARAGARA